ncbi:hypothetical protein JTB14_012187 [Gonioctena quinquepunctata]|nr:hypothetical protein JTB14_012187 [Gonioctena quinquepunctata]
MSEIKVTKTLPEHSRKRVVQSNKHKRTISKQNRYSAKSLPKYPTCSHKEGTIKCRTLSMMDIKRFHELFYNNKDKVAQDTLIYKCCYALKPKRSRLAINARAEPAPGVRPAKRLNNQAASLSPSPATEMESNSSRGSRTCSSGMPSTRKRSREILGQISNKPKIQRIRTKKPSSADGAAQRTASRQPLIERDILNVSRVLLTAQSTSPVLATVFQNIPTTSTAEQPGTPTTSAVPSSSAIISRSATPSTSAIPNTSGTILPDTMHDSFESGSEFSANNNDSEDSNCEELLRTHTYKRQRLMGRMGYLKASKAFNVPQSTLEDRVKKARANQLTSSQAARKNSLGPHIAVR